MSSIPNAVERFIFDYVDSIGFLEILLLLQATPERTWTADAIAAELRGNQNSAAQTLRQLADLRLIFESSPGSYRMDLSDPALAELLENLAQVYKTQRHKLYELIFSPLKKARDFAGAFTRAKKEDGDG